MFAVFHCIASQEEKRGDARPLVWMEERWEIQSVK
jgi:hypothetical protein